ncbi:ornithine carbamoyltransferase [Nocardioides nematodiphilus]|uniref:ornithine carbamoyltransferase n=1 Tax=Nocardioides nematodiphilus TaxID=2849669 RepID=UPI001CD9D188|nr:ornithine carbamoyltransferase [Nocardioides nematodiphilus]MCA1984756.1 ornithine carbamoyltransferase [Nocardioides nematodiphilus]
MSALEGLQGRDFLKEIDLSVEEWHALLDLARSLKAERRSPDRVPRLSGRTIALLFEKASTRTRCAFEVAAYEEGAHVTYLDPESSHVGHKESVADTARVLSRMYDGIEYRGFAQSAVEALARYADVPVWNGLTDLWHPTQSLCDVMTMLEHVDKPAEQIRVAYVGDARNNVANSLLVAGAMMGMDVRMVAPASRQSPPQVTAAARAIAANTGARVRHTTDVAGGVDHVDVVYTDVWLSMGEPEELWDERISLLMPYRVDSVLMDKTGNPDVKFMHCLPALHGTDTELGLRLSAHTGMAGLEVSDDVFESERSIVFDQAENRMHTIKAVLIATLGGAG